MTTFARKVAGDLGPITAARLLRQLGILALGKEAKSLQVKLPSEFDPEHHRVYRFRRKDFE